MIITASSHPTPPAFVSFPCTDDPNLACYAPAPVSSTVTLSLEHLDRPDAPLIECDHGVNDLALTKTEVARTWHLYVVCNGERRMYKITIQ